MTTTDLTPIDEDALYGQAHAPRLLRLLGERDQEDDRD